ncbi:NINE protein [Campylobacter canadensis]|uniref:NINE protein n=1 Tax=Campylobacter canadensis TaxID=449520 RepID=A0ABS7WUE7_9BACT|nr:NINE protein [Campylobacter canadensis]MBZ7987957.1 NINE protein [Campylobacter canadensis]MBZ7995042.1 NINE protein [Campylobacter canadensis]MBZ7996681.1 NINE protein [Campylobacter canadensis]MBZ7998516.1 NINE protein [Campylobacter canadensis]MBZ8000288.1 NINE protein [Campylobacter canadensis]
MRVKKSNFYRVIVNFLRSFNPFKNPIVAVILGFFFGGFGVDRFYQGSYFLGFLKLALLIIGFVTAFIFIGVFILWGLGIYVLIDLFFVYKAVQRDNYHKILLVLE